MLLRTRQTLRKKCRNITLLIRLFLFVSIPSVYFVFNGFSKASDAKDFDVNYLPDAPIMQEPSLSILDNDIEMLEVHSSRHLLSVLSDRIGRNCTPPAILEFPSDGLTRTQRKQGFVLLHIMLASYCFILLAIVCDDYFVPAISSMCYRLHISEDIAGATFMAAASSSPELFINCVGTFVTHGDIGVGTIVGSAVFNILAVPACCGLFAGQVVDLDWWAVSRDSLMYGVAVISLIFTLQDDRVMWYEALILVTFYVLYISAMYFNTALSTLANSGCCFHRMTKRKQYTEVTPLLNTGKTNSLEQTPTLTSHFKVDEARIDMEKNDCNNNSSELESSTSSVWTWPDDTNTVGKKLFWIFTWPISLILWLSIPDCKKYQKLYLVTFGMCVFWIGITAYMVAWLITVIGDTMNIPDSVMGLTFLAAGTSVPEAVSSIIVTNQGHGGMGISNSIGSNTFDILLCLGLPWLVKSLFYPATPGQYYVTINSSGIAYSSISLFSTLIGLYVSFACNKFRLDWKIGLTCTMMYLAFVCLATLIEMNVFFPVNLPTCPH